MEIGFRRSNFAQFSEDLWLYVKVDGTKIEFDVSKSDIPGFVQHLLSVAYDAMYKMDRQDVCDKITPALDILS